MNDDLQCPHCQTWNEAYPDEWEPDVLIDYQCTGCKKEFQYWIEYRSCYYVKKVMRDNDV